MTAYWIPKHFHGQQYVENSQNNDYEIYFLHIVPIRGFINIALITIHVEIRSESQI